MTGRRHLGVAATVLALVVLAAACAGTGSGRGRQTLRVLTHEGFPLDAELFAQFEADTESRVAVIVERDPDTMLDVLTASTADPPFDVVAGLDTLTIAAFLDTDLALPHTASDADVLLGELRVAGDPVLPLSYIDHCLNVDTVFFEPPPEPLEIEFDAEDTDEEVDLSEFDPTAEPPPVVPPPTRLLDLAEETYRGILALPDPAVDRTARVWITGLVIGGQPTLVASLFSGLRANGAEVSGSWRDNYFGTFTQGSEAGEFPVVLASSLMPAVTQRLVNPEDYPIEPPTTVMLDGCVRDVTYAARLRSSSNALGAAKLLDVLVGPEAQFALYDARGARPARTDLILPPEVERFGVDVQPVRLGVDLDLQQVREAVGQWAAAAPLGQDAAGAEAGVDDQGGSP